ncbi:hypothetical protein [Enterobacter sp.]|nr:hypothetical protein [Enterobacter sp.]
MTTTLIAAINAQSVLPQASTHLQPVLLYLRHGLAVPVTGCGL